MKLSKSYLYVAGTLAFASIAQSQVMTEVRISTSGVDQEYVEIQGLPGQSTDGLMVLVVEGDPAGATGGVGTLDFAYDLAGDVFTNQFYVLGSSEAASAFPGDIDNASYGDNMFENSSATIYLVNVPDPIKRQDIIQTWAGTDISDPVGSLTTRIATDAAVELLDAVAFWDGDAGDVFYDGAPEFGPDGNFLPSGILRDGGCPGEWCTDTFINFSTNGTPNPPYADPSPNAINPTTGCTTTASAGSCGGSGSVGTPYCTANNNSTGSTSALGASGTPLVASNDLSLEASSLPVNSFGFFLASLDSGFVANPGGSAGNLCLGGSIGRYVGAGQIKNSGSTGAFALALDLTQVPQPTGFVSISAGETWRFQAWHRDAVGGSATSNFTNGLEVSFL